MPLDWFKIVIQPDNNAQHVSFISHILLKLFYQFTSKSKVFGMSTRGAGALAPIITIDLVTQIIFRNDLV